MHLVHHGQVLIHTIVCLLLHALLAAHGEVDGLKGKRARSTMWVTVHLVSNPIFHPLE